MTSETAQVEVLDTNTLRYDGALWKRSDQQTADHIEYAEMHVVFDGPPGPECGRFVEVEDQDGKGMRRGEWIERPDGLWALKMDDPAWLRAELEALRLRVTDFLNGHLSTKQLYASVVGVPPEWLLDLKCRLEVGSPEWLADAKRRADEAA